MHPKTETANSVSTFRQAELGDAEAIRLLTREAYAKWVPLIGREPLPMTEDYQEALRKHRFDLTFFDKTLAALIETISHDDHLLIVNVAVSPAFQGKGLGKRLLAHAEHLATSFGIAEIKLYTNKLFADNLTLYKKLGYGVALRCGARRRLHGRYWRLHEQSRLNVIFFRIS